MRNRQAPRLRFDSSFTRPWLIGGGLIIFGIFTLFLVLGWFAHFELLAIAAGIAALGGLVLLYGLAHPDLRWPGWAAYLLFSVAVFFAAAFFLDFQPLYTLAVGTALLGLPFLTLYIRRVWLERRPGYWWAGLPAGVLLTGAAALVQLRLGWPPHMVRGLAIFTFMGGMAVTLFMIWAPNYARPAFGWMIGPIILTGLIAGYGLLDATDLEFLMIPLVLLTLGAYFLLRGAIRGALAGPTRPPAPGGTSRRAPALPARPAPAALPHRELLTLPGDAPALEPAPPATICVSSPDFPPDGPLPVACTCDGTGESPPLTWEGLPAGTGTLALICDTADAPETLQTHWLIYNLPAAVRELPRALPPGGAPGDARQGLNDFGEPGYSGPCPPPGAIFRYTFTLYALDGPLPLPSGASRAALIEAMRGHVLATGRLTGTYSRAPARPPL